MIAQKDRDLLISAITIAEIWRGILLKPAGKKRKALEQWFAGPEGPAKLFGGRVLPFDERAALVWARIMVDGKSLGLSLHAIDMQIAAIAEANGCTVVTANENDFRTVQYINPMAT